MSRGLIAGVAVSVMAASSGVASADPTQIDVLVVVDDSPGMAEEQAALVLGIDDLVDGLRAGGILPDLHLGVVSTDVGIPPFDAGGCSGDGDDGVLQHVPQVAGCAPPIDVYLADKPGPRGTRIRNYTGSLTDAFACVATLGTDGCDFEQPLEAIRRALDGRHPENAGFLRPGSTLVVIVLSDEDDCSAQDTGVFDPDPIHDHISSAYGPFDSFRCTEHGLECDGGTIARAPASYGQCRPRPGSYLAEPDDLAAALASLHPDGDLYVGVLGGPIDPATAVTVTANGAGEPQLASSCSGASGPAAPAVRLAAFAAAFPGRSQVHRICELDLSTALGAIGAAVAGRYRVASSPSDDAAADDGARGGCSTSGSATPHGLVGALAALACGVLSRRRRSASPAGT
jgi:hypothetical protein